MSKLFTGLRIGQLELAHRLVASVEADPRLTVADYRRRSTSGGLLIAEGVGVSDEERWNRIVEGVHDAGGLMVALVSPGLQIARDVDVDAAMDVYQTSARLARAIGFDGVELDSGAGALAECFLQKSTNSRDDDYGGDIEGRMRFLLEAAHVVAAEFSPERAGVRLSPCEHVGQLEVLADVMRALSERELAYVHLAHLRSSAQTSEPGKSVSIAACAERQAFRSDVSCALIASDFVDVDIAASAVERRWADAIGFLQTDDDPDFIARMLHAQRGNR